MARLEQRVAALEDAGTPAVHPAPPDLVETDPLWVLTGLEARSSEDAVVLAGSATTGSGRVRWQYGRPSSAVEDAEWSASADAFAALGHPARLSMLQSAHRGASTVADLAHEAGGGSTGQAYHHLNQLVGAGWLRPRARGRYEIPPERAVPLLVALLAAGAA